ncbi:MAG: 3-oxoadipate enol-lactonase [Gammaproteobacteria bacterium]|nr:3-oxoadipate enol-lactonase [Gammaproteobacteria bacterium]MBU1416416.1 3-oxoadipate enol-lactonase [Gammaproteobacteria bacterium]
MNTIHTNGIDIHYDVQGEGPWLILSHSLGTDVTLWDDQMDTLTPHFRVLRFDTRGHGGSSAPTIPYDFAMLTADVLGLMDELDIERAHFCGISMGGMIAQHVALAAPERIDKLVLLSTTSGYPPEARALWAERIEGVRRDGVKPLVKATLERWFTAPYRAALPEVMERIARLIRATPAAGYIGSCQAIAALDVTDRLSALRCPTLVIAGADDAGTPPAMGRKIAEQIPGARIELVSQASHLCNIEQKSRVNSLLRLFLEP